MVLNVINTQSLAQIKFFAVIIPGYISSQKAGKKDVPQLWKLPFPVQWQMHQKKLNDTEDQKLLFKNVKFSPSVTMPRKTWQQKCYEIT